MYFDQVKCHNLAEISEELIAKIAGEFRWANCLNTYIDKLDEPLVIIYFLILCISLYFQVQTFETLYFFGEPEKKPCLAGHASGMSDEQQKQLEEARRRRWTREEEEDIMEEMASTTTTGSPASSLSGSQLSLSSGTHISNQVIFILIIKWVQLRVVEAKEAEADQKKDIETGLQNDCVIPLEVVLLADL
jgi:hypothetical protein